MSDTNTTASGRLHAPAVGLIVTGILGVLLQLGSIVNELLGNPLQEAMLDFLAAQGMDTASFDSLPLSGGLLFGTQFVLQLVMGLVFLALSGFVAWGGFQHRRRHRRLPAVQRLLLPRPALRHLGHRRPQPRRRPLRLRRSMSTLQPQRRSR
jgi:hypothetical protein